ARPGRAPRPPVQGPCGRLSSAFSLRFFWPPGERRPPAADAARAIGGPRLAHGRVRGRLPRKENHMHRALAAVLGGLFTFSTLVLFGLTAAYIVSGPERVFEAGSRDPTTLWAL